MNFYTYILARPSGVPFYIGKGHGQRWTYGGNKWAKRIARKVQHQGGKIKAMIFPAASEAKAFRREIDLIAAYGRRDIGTGVLCNLTDGGEGASGLMWSDEGRANLSAASKGKPKSAKHRAALSAAHKGQNLGGTLPDIAKEKIRKAAKRISADPAERKRRSERAKAQHAAGNFGRATWTEESSRSQISKAKALHARGLQPGTAAMIATVEAGGSEEMSRRSRCRSLYNKQQKET